jgi:hypothetical protein
MVRKAKKLEHANSVLLVTDFMTCELIRHHAIKTRGIEV